MVWYKRSFRVPEHMTARRLLRFGAADYEAGVWLDGQFLGSHTGGYSDFFFDITDLTQPGGVYPGRAL